MGIADAIILALVLAAGAFVIAGRGSEGATAPESSTDLVALTPGETNEVEADTLNLNAPGHAVPTSAVGSSSVVESPGTIASSWSMPPLPEDGSWATSGTSQSPVTKTSSSVMALH
jgi:hypothetical protein